MELTYDWRCFQSMFYPKRRAPGVRAQECSTPVYLVVDEGKIMAAYGEGDDFSSWIGSSYQDMAAEVTHRELILFDRKNVDQWLSQSLTLPHFYDQVEYLREQANPQTVKRSRFKFGPRALVLKEALEVPVNRHFVLDAIRSWWGKVLPSSYGIFFRLEGDHQQQNLMIIIRRGRVDSFIEPDFHSMGKDRSKIPADVVKYLSEKYLVPVQGVFMAADQWQEWSDSEHPWRSVAMAIKANEAKLVPFRWGVVSLIATRAFLDI